MKTNIHASCVALGKKGVLLLGPSGSCKSDMALRLIDGGARLVSDDRTDLSVRGGRLMARCPATIAGLIEVRGLGIVALPHVKQIAIVLAVRLGRAAVRHPEPQFYEFPGAEPVRLMTMDGRESAAAAKIRLVVARGRLFTEKQK